MEDKLAALAKVLETMDTLRGQCPWDKKQTIQTLRSLTIEETYELSEAIQQQSWDKIREELGDLLLHIAFYAKIGEEEKKFTIKDVANDLVEKLVERHPHIYADVIVENDQDVKDNWEKIKTQNGNKTTLGGVPNSLPSMIKAIRIQDKARGVGFDWDHKEQVWDKTLEELNEFKVEIDAHIQDQDKLEAEFGDILFSIVNLARFYNINPDDALEKTNRKFIGRFNKMEKAIKAESKSLSNMPLVEMEEYWQRAKKKALRD
ncbi:MAG: nucleoside triphosphate pyrophosphohydrolase [Bacteroidetes bacterium]|jgi:XTP/dITP diphosphohydrolase|nr:nucleoside triphosphate pyrophosphohydrolase [Bacteroidota bacterium]MBT3934712.1 nucleoside triphosphate pyrophosphohydrolase [Bacteroidota bacterium]MBT4339942.1 nucleoside triphosphate pyrophosphohydrolase [Bacteroidota bacterium]MBT4729633.1 nucleoside triphosphate pyrophosphohydrolase [Bacteroidota bacterium]MBT5991690.1 nucleoside triphosphate pyrophosphohydrolase [Bacteroidota bacterium]